MDLSTIIGLVLGFGGLIIGFLMEGGNPASLLSLSSIIIILGGTLGAVFVSFPMNEMKKMPQLFKIAFTNKDRDLASVILYFEKLANKVRSEGLLSLEEYLEGEESKNVSDLIKKGIQLVVDGTDPELIRDILQTDLSAMAERHKIAANIFAAAGGYSPTMGVIGTVMGLVNAMANMSAGAEKLVESIGGAFIATLYGVSIANLIWLPIGNKLKLKSAGEMLENKLIVEGILSIQSGENPRIIVEKLKSFVPRDQAEKLNKKDDEKEKE
jgi:chemotaxis protein MotA